MSQSKEKVLTRSCSIILSPTSRVSLDHLLFFFFFDLTIVVVRSAWKPFAAFDFHLLVSLTSLTNIIQWTLLSFSVNTRHRKRREERSNIDETSSFVFREGIHLKDVLTDDNYSNEPMIEIVRDEEREEKHSRLNRHQSTPSGSKLVEFKDWRGKITQPALPE